MPGASALVVSSHPAVSIGRSRDNDLVIADLRVSRHHARIELVDGFLWARDLESKNMTYLDGVPLLGTRRLGDDSELRIGVASLHISRSLAPAAATATP
ncbi:MAG: FHA domain-containing protein [Coriobacteriales bacterium]|jgi:pSer/pThr/pTyr-binding forkhead associated (FHA) protein